MGLEDKLPNGILLTNLERFVNYSRSTSPSQTCNGV